MSAIVASFHQIDIEPVKTANPAENDLPQVNKPEEEEKIPEKGRFAELLANLLRNTSGSENVRQIQNAAEDANIDSASELIPVIAEIDPAIFGIEDQSLFNKLNIDALKDNALSGSGENHLDAQALLSEIETALGINEGDHLNEIPVFTEADILQEAELEADFFDVNLKNNSNIDALQALASQDTEAADNVKKAQKSQDTSENIPNLAVNKSDTDNENPRAGRENEKSAAADDIRATAKRDSRRSRASLEVHDMRTRDAANKNGAANGAANGFASIEASAGRAAAGADPAVREMTLELRLPQTVPEQNNALNQANTSWEAKAGSAVENLLARELHQNFNGDIVRHASVLLKDGDNAVIRLALKPETLGNVKIALELSDNKITGKILVESDEAFNAFRKEVASLEQQFKDSGFTEANLDLFMASDDHNMEGWDKPNKVHPVFASRYEDNADQKTVNFLNIYFERGKGSINLLA